MTDRLPVVEILDPEVVKILRQKTLKNGSRKHSACGKPRESWLKRRFAISIQTGPKLRSCVKPPTD